MDYQDKEARATGAEPAGEIRRRNIAAAQPNSPAHPIEFDEKTKQEVRLFRSLKTNNKADDTRSKRLLLQLSSMSPSLGRFSSLS